MQKFQQILKEAAQLKESQLKNQRKNFQSLPEYLKAGLNYSKKYQKLRNQHYLIQIHMSEKVKKQGNLLFKKQRYAQSLAKYEEALAIFRYVTTQSYDNMKDEHLSYECFNLGQGLQRYLEEYQTHLVALYLNICSCLTKTNKKEDAIHSADQALKLKQTAKGNYKKAQVYLQYINRDTSDIKLGFYYLNKCYQLSKDPSIVQEMHKIKKQIDDQRNKEKEWFKFMFDKNSKARAKEEDKQIKSDDIKAIKSQRGEKVVESKNDRANTEMKREIQKQQKVQPQQQKLERTKQKLFKFANLDLNDQQWLQSYQGEFIGKHGSKMYSILQLFGMREYMGEYKSLLAQCLECKKDSYINGKRRQTYSKYFEWLRKHPVDKIAKYIERYDLQTQWVKGQRQRLTNERKNSVIQNFVIGEKQETKQQEPQVKMEEIKMPSNRTSNSMDLIQQVRQVLEKQPQQIKRQEQHQESLQTVNNMQAMNPQPQQEIKTPSQSENQQSFLSKLLQNKDRLKMYSFFIAFIVLFTLKFLI